MMEVSRKPDESSGEATPSARHALLETTAFARNLLVRYGLLLVTIVLIVLFTFLLPSTFLTALTFRAILSDQSIVALVSLAQMFLWRLTSSTFPSAMG